MVEFLRVCERSSRIYVVTEMFERFLNCTRYKVFVPKISHFPIVQLSDLYSEQVKYNEKLTTEISVEN